MGQYAEMLRQLDSDYDRAPVAGSNDLPPAGDYQCIVDRFDFIVSRKNGRLYLKTEMTVAVGDLKGHPVSTLHDAGDPERLKYLKAHLQALQVEPPSLGELEDYLPRALDAVVTVRVKEFAKSDGTIGRDAYVNGRIITDIPTSLPPAIGSHADNVPF